MKSAAATGPDTPRTAAAALPTSRWRGTRANGRRGAADRVRRSHAQTRSTLRIALGFFAAAAVAWAIGDTSWLALHLFLAGGVVLAISGVSLMLTVTWSAAPARSDRLVLLQRTCVAVGAAGVAAGRELDVRALVAVGGLTYVAGLVLLAVLLVTTARRGVERRFDPAVLAYVAALAAGVAGVGIGVAMAVDGPSLSLRGAHVTVNLLGLVGLVVVGTLPFFAATVGRSRMAPQATAGRITLVVGWQVAAVACAAIAFVAGAEVPAAAALAAYACGIGGALLLTPRPTRRQLRWAGPRLLALWCGAAWWIAAVVAAAVEVAGGRGVPFTGAWLLVLVIAGYGQIVWGSLAYLLPMLRGGGHERLSEGFTATRSWAGLVAVNVAGFALAVSARWVATVAVAVWILDAAVRAARVGLRGRTALAREGEQA